MVDELKRTTLIVRDAERAAQWYEKVFGLTRWMDTPFTLSGTQLAAGQKGDQTRLIILKCQHDTIGMIGLLEWLEPKQDTPDELPTEIKFGAPIFVFACEDAKRATETALSLGSRVHCEPHEWTVTGAHGKQIDMIGCSFWDLDGYFYEVNQTLKVHD